MGEKLNMQFVFYNKRVHLVIFLSQKCRGKVNRLEKMAMCQFTVPCPPGVSPSTKDAIVKTKKSPIECTVNDDSVGTPRKNPSSSTDISLPVIFVGKTKETCIICRKDQKGLRPLKSPQVRLSIVANISLIVKKKAHQVYDSYYGKYSEYEM